MRIGLFKKCVKLLRFDTRGNGRSGTSVGDCTLDQIIDRPEMHKSWPL